MSCMSQSTPGGGISAQSGSRQRTAQVSGGCCLRVNVRCLLLERSREGVSTALREQTEGNLCCGTCVSATTHGLPEAAFRMLNLSTKVS